MEIKELLKANIKLLDANLLEMKKMRRELGTWQYKYGWRWNKEHPIKKTIPDHDCHGGPESGCKTCSDFFKY